MGMVVNSVSCFYCDHMEINTRVNCPVARAMEIVGDRWSILILRNLILDGPHRYQDFANALDGISPTTLSSRLKTLQKNGLIRRDVVDSHPPKAIYELTERGCSMKPVLQALRRFGSDLPLES